MQAGYDEAMTARDREKAGYSAVVFDYDFPPTWQKSQPSTLALHQGRVERLMDNQRLRLSKDFQSLLGPVSRVGFTQRSN